MMLRSDSIHYLGNEIKYGATLYVSGWRKLLLHPLQTIKDIMYAFCHPIQTGKILFNELKQHPIGMAVNMSLSWATGRFTSIGIHHLRAINISNMTANLPEIFQNSSAISESALASVSQVVQVSAQAMSGGCCGGICTTTAARLSQTTSIIASQSVFAENKRSMQSQSKKISVENKNFSPYFDGKKEGQKCSRTCATKKGPTAQRNKKIQNYDK